MTWEFFYRLDRGHEATMPGKAGRIVGSGAKKPRAEACFEHATAEERSDVLPPVYPHFYRSGKLQVSLIGGYEPEEFGGGYMNTISRTLAGTGAILFGALVTYIAITEQTPLLLIYGLPALIIGIFLLFNKKEDEIEPIKGHKNKQRKD